MPVSYDQLPLGIDPAATTAAPTREITVINPPPPMQPHNNEAVSLLQTIQQAAMRPDFRVDVMERLVELKLRMDARAAEAEFHAAMNKFHGECPPIPRRHIGQFEVTVNGVKRPTKYANLEDIDAVVRPVLAANGLSRRWTKAVIADGMLTLDCIISHSAGHSESSAASMPITSRAGCSDAQKMMSAFTYAQRASLICALGLTTCDEDVDGADPRSSDEPRITQEQAYSIRDALLQKNKSVDGFCKAFGIDKPENIRAAQWGLVVSLLRSWGIK